jgi:hypothetical protein
MLPPLGCLALAGATCQIMYTNDVDYIQASDTNPIRLACFNISTIFKDGTVRGTLELPAPEESHPVSILGVSGIAAHVRIRQF